MFYFSGWLPGLFSRHERNSQLRTWVILFMGFLFFSCLISFPFLSTILKNGMEGGGKNFHVKVWAMCLVQERGKLLILRGWCQMQIRVCGWENKLTFFFFLLLKTLKSKLQIPTGKLSAFNQSSEETYSLQLLFSVDVLRKCNRNQS